MTNRFLPALALAAFALLSPAAASAQTALAAAQPATARPAAPVDERALRIFNQVLQHVRSQYVEEIPDEKLIEAAVGGIMGSLDPHSTYLDAEKYVEMRERTSGQFVGLGIEIQMDTAASAVKVISPFDGSPAASAGMQPGDLILEIAGEPVKGLTLKQASDRLRGPIGSDVSIKVKREATEPFVMTLKRDMIRSPSVKYEAEGEVGYIRIASFTEQTQNGVEQAIRAIQAKLGDKLAGYVLDLRNNPGGLLRQGILVADSFLEQGMIVSTRGRNGREIDRATATPGDLTGGKPLVVLINGGSASASEIVAGALQDNHRATILGVQSYGKGSVQSIMPLRETKAAIKMTTARYYTPSGRSIQNVGITPDLGVDQPKTAAIHEPEIRKEAELRKTLSNDAPPTGKTQPAVIEAPPADAANSDWQRRRAVDQVLQMAGRELRRLPQQQAAAR
ncbi:S41 family peptidase [Arenibaculum pallidiluteum]|uniref:S41 family peptidase n=1 Tax=Arenibaculum pallidiluteum TaxID=2812559 RepID=UPI001A97BBCD|nr:S41 family peptidase [Arenibaculum pallidiluteum]